MKKMVIVLPVVFLVLVLTFGSLANEVTHTLGTTGYMIQEAMWAKANKHDPDNYYKAIQLQSEAKKYMRGTHKQGRSVTKAMELSQEAYGLAKTARDNALARRNLKVSY